MVASVQSISADPSPVTSEDRKVLTGDMYALAAYLLRTANVGTFQAIAELDLSFTQIKALCALEVDGQDSSVKALADSLGLSLAAMSRAVDGLFERGLVGRCTDPADGRGVRLSLTAAGRAVQHQVGQAHARTVARAMTAGLTHDELGQLEALTRKLALAQDKDLK